MQHLERKHGDRRPLRLSLDRDLTGYEPVVVRIGRAAGEAAVIEVQAVVEDEQQGVIRVELTEQQVGLLTAPHRWLVEARPADGSIHPDASYLVLEVHEPLGPAPE